MTPLTPAKTAVLTLLADADHSGNIPDSAKAVVEALAGTISRSRVYEALDALAEARMVTPKSAWRQAGIALTEAGRREAAALAAANAVRSGAAPAAAPGGPVQEGTLPLDCLQPSGLNPRRRFDEAGLEELADSIAKAGVLQNLIVRPLPAHMPQTASGDPPHEVIAGERRWRALDLLRARGAVAPDHPVPVRILEMDDTAALMLAITENAQRQDIHPLDEGEAFLALYDRARESGDDHDQVAARIATETGKTRRWVEKRIALARRLSEPVREAFRGGAITLAHAQAIAIAGPRVQQRTLAAIETGDPDYQTAERAAAAIRAQAVPVAHAEPLAAHGLDTEAFAAAGGRVIDVYGAPHFDDRELYLKLSKKAAKALAASLRVHRAWVEVTPYPQNWRYETAPKGTPLAETGCVICPPSRWDTQTQIADRLRPKTESTGDAMPAEATWTRAHFTWAADVKTDALQAALMERPEVLLAVTTGDRLMDVYQHRAGRADNAPRRILADSLHRILDPRLVIWSRDEHAALVEHEHELWDASLYPLLRRGETETEDMDIQVGLWRALAAHYAALDDRAAALLAPLLATEAIAVSVPPSWDWDAWLYEGDGAAYWIAELCGGVAIDHAAALAAAGETYGEIASPARKLALAAELGVPEERRAELRSALDHDMPMGRSHYAEWLLEHAADPIHLPELAWRAPAREDAGETAEDTSEPAEARAVSESDRSPIGSQLEETTDG